MRRLTAGLALMGAGLMMAGAAPGAHAGQPSTLVGRWTRVTTCQQLVRALDDEGLRPVAPAILAGNGLVEGTPEELSRKRHICSDATPRRHSHFFDSSGWFGSLDWQGGQVDGAPYRIVDDHTVSIGDASEGAGTFHYRVRGGELRLQPVISAAEKRAALAHPLEFSVAGWMVAVSYPGHTWSRAPCDGWC